MKITDEHPLYAKRSTQWRRCRDLIEGSDAVKGAGELYLPRLPGQSDLDYKAYKLRAVFYNATGRTLEGLSGLILSKDPEVDSPSGSEKLIEDCDLMGRPFEALLEDAIEEVLTVGRFGVMIDHTPNVDGAMKDEVDRLGIRPYVIRVHTESIINWELSRIDNRYKLSRIVLREGCTNESGEDDEKYRELVLEDRIYHLKTWSRKKKKDAFEVTENLVPLMKGSPLQELPFWFFGAEFGEQDPDRPPLIDLIDINLAHYLTSADKRHALYHCGLPTPVFAGAFDFGKSDTGDPKDGEIKLGGNSAIFTTDSSAHWSYLEFSGQGVQPLKEELNELESMMAKLGARLLAEEKKQAEAAETMRIRSSGESSALAQVAKSISKTATQVLTFLCSWGGYDGDCDVELNTDYSVTGLTAPEILARVQAFQAGTISLIDLIKVFQLEGVIPGDRTPEDVKAELDDAVPPGGIQLPTKALTDNTAGGAA